MFDLSYLLKGLILLYTLSLTSGLKVHGDIITPREKEEIEKTASQLLIELSEKEEGFREVNEPVLSENDDNVATGSTTPSPTSITSPPEVTNIKDPTPTPTERPAEIENVDITPTLAIKPAAAGDNGSLVMQEINSYRISLGFTPFSTHPAVCDFAKLRALELTTNFSHEGFEQRFQNGSLPYESFSKVAENIANIATYSGVFELWKNSEGHNKNLLSESLFACVGNVGRYYAFESWKP